MIHDANSAFRQISRCSTNLLLRYYTIAIQPISRRPAYAATAHRLVYKSSFGTSEEEYETSHDRWDGVSSLSIQPQNICSSSVASIRASSLQATRSDGQATK